MTARWPSVLGLTVALLGLAAAPGLARYSDSPSVPTNGFSTATLTPPTNVTTTPSCSGVLNRSITLDWTASGSTFADGYDVFQGTTNGGPYTLAGHVVGGTTTTYTHSGLQPGRTYYYRVRTTAHAWTSAQSPQVQGTAPTACT